MFVLASAVSIVYLVYESKLKAKRMIEAGEQRRAEPRKSSTVSTIACWRGVSCCSALRSSAARFGPMRPGDISGTGSRLESWSLVIWITVCGAARIASHRRMARATRGGAHHRRVHGAGRIVRVLTWRFRASTAGVSAEMENDSLHTWREPSHAPLLQCVKGSPMPRTKIVAGAADDSGRRPASARRRCFRPAIALR